MNADRVIVRSAYDGIGSKHDLTLPREGSTRFDEDGSMLITRRTILATAPVAAVMSGSAMAQAPAATPPVTEGRQMPGFYRYKVGDFEVTAFHDGTAVRPLDDKFAVVST